MSPSLAEDVGRVRSMSRDLHDVEADFSASPKRQRSPTAQISPLRESEEETAAERVENNAIKEGGEFLWQLQTLFREADIDNSGPFVSAPCGKMLTLRCHAPGALAPEEMVGVLRKLYANQSTSRSEKKIYSLVCQCLDQYDMDRSVSVAVTLPRNATHRLLC